MQEHLQWNQVQVFCRQQGGFGRSLPLAKERVEALPDGRVRIALKRAWSDGTTALELSRLELVERLMALVPPPRANQVHYHGVLASRSRLRAREGIGNINRS